MQVLMLSAEHGEEVADSMLARIGMMRALNRSHPPKPFDTSRKDKHWENESY
jgi:hypothetical protein